MGWDTISGKINACAELNFCFITGLEIIEKEKPLFHTDFQNNKDLIVWLTPTCRLLKNFCDQKWIKTISELRDVMNSSSLQGIAGFQKAEVC